MQDVGKTDIGEWVANAKPFYANVKEGDYRVGIYEGRNNVGVAYGDSEKEAIENAKLFAASQKMLTLLNNFKLGSGKDVGKSIEEVNLFLKQFNS